MILHEYFAPQPTPTSDLPDPGPLIEGLTAPFERIWQQGPEQEVTLSLPYAAWRDESAFKYWRYRVMEATGLSTF